MCGMEYRATNARGTPKQHRQSDSSKSCGWWNKKSVPMESRNELSCSISRRYLWSLENTFVLLGALIVHRFSSEFDSVIAVLLRGVKTSGETVSPQVNFLWYSLKAAKHIVIAVMACSCCISARCHHESRPPACLRPPASAICHDRYFP